MTSIKSPKCNNNEIEVKAQKNSHESEAKVKIRRPVTALKNLKQASS